MPGALSVADLPEIARKLAPRPVTANAAWDVGALAKAAGAS